MQLILASNSSIRRKLLENSGLSFLSHSANVDEQELKQKCTHYSPAELALYLANAKAKSLSLLYPDAFILGADQVLFKDQEIYSKPESRTDLVRRLLDFSGKWHGLFTAVSIYRGGELVWDYGEEALLKMHDLDEATLLAYVMENYETVRHSVGGYLIESTGIRLFSEIKGDYFTILGLPLLPVLNFLHMSKMKEV